MLALFEGYECISVTRLGLFDVSKLPPVTKRETSLPTAPLHEATSCTITRPHRISVSTVLHGMVDNFPSNRERCQHSCLENHA